MRKIRHVSIGVAAQLLGCPPWNLLRLYERLMQRPVPRSRGWPVIPTEDLPRLEAALERGYLPPSELIAENWPWVFNPPSPN